MIASQVIQFKWQGTVPGADSNTYVLLATCNPGTTQTDRVIQNMNRDGANAARIFAMNALHKFCLTLKNSQAGVLNEYYSDDRGVNWILVSTQAAPIPAVATEVEFLIQNYTDWKLEWVNGGVAQATWTPQMSLSTERAAP